MQSRRKRLPGEFGNRIGNRILRAWASFCETPTDIKVLQVVDLQGFCWTAWDTPGRPENLFFLHGVQGVASSNPATPTNEINALVVTSRQGVLRFRGRAASH
jgi:hypothetical protein